ncbi:MAG: DEAD/DEAH box helicase family protein, partial [Lachnospiraceae bacterium]|nr:DEAD/DEAH box helicase family protein [Lachnospiraceae bacterium]
YMKNYHPRRCSGEFCPYYGECENSGNIVNTLAMDRRVYREGEEEKTYPMEEARECLRENLEEAYGSTRQGIHLIKAQTGLGKTRGYIQLIKEHPEAKFLVALPTNMQKEQVAGDLSAKLGEDVFKTVSVRGNLLLPPEVREEIMQAHQQGFHDRTKKIIKEYCKGIKDVQGNLAVVGECQRILDGVRAMKGERVIVTTHAYMGTLPEGFLRQYNIIIDEDILMLQFLSGTSTVSESCLHNLLQLGNPEYARIAGEMLGAKEGEYRRIQGSPYAEPFTSEELGETGMSQDDNINDITSAEAFVRMDGKVKYFCPKKLPRLKYIVLSATLNQGIYRAYFKGEMDVWTYQEKKAAYKGKLIQYTYYPFGRGSLGKRIRGVIGFLLQLAGYHAPDIPNL